MSAATTTRITTKTRFGTKRIVGAIIVIAVLVTMGLNTTVVPIGSSAGTVDKFMPDAYGEQKFPEIRDLVQQHAVPATELAAAISQDKQAAVDKYAITTGAIPVMAVTFTGTVGKGQLGTYNIKIDGVPESIKISVQTGPAVIGTALRDSDPSIQFGDFTNQIDYQNAAAGINNAMKKVVLADIDRQHLSGKTITVVGAFKLINPNSWRVTPVKVGVQ